GERGVQRLRELSVQHLSGRVAVPADVRAAGGVRRVPAGDADFGSGGFAARVARAGSGGAVGRRGAVPDRVPGVAGDEAAITGRRESAAWMTAWTAGPCGRLSVCAEPATRAGCPYDIQAPHTRCGGTGAWCTEIVLMRSVLAWLGPYRCSASPGHMIRDDAARCLCRPTSGTAR